MRKLRPGEVYRDLSELTVLHTVRARVNPKPTEAVLSILPPPLPLIPTKDEVVQVQLPLQ